MVHFVQNTDFESMNEDLADIYKTAFKFGFYGPRKIAKFIHSYDYLYAGLGVAPLTLLTVLTLPPAALFAGMCTATRVPYEIKYSVEILNDTIKDAILEWKMKKRKKSNNCRSQKNKNNGYTLFKPTVETRKHEPAKNDSYIRFKGK